MLSILTADEMRALERWASDVGGVASLALQEAAAQGAVDLIPGDVQVEVIAGPGNNGGDALAVARLLKQRGQPVRVWTLAPKPVWRGDAALQAERWQAAGGDFTTTQAPEAEAIWHPATWFVDGMFGLGVKGPLEAEADAWAHALSRPGRGGTLLSLDQPSWLHPDDVDYNGFFNPVDVTACFGFLKPCHAFMPSEAACGRVVVIPLPLPSFAETGCPVQPTLGRSGAPVIKVPPWNSFKGDHGRVTIRAGSMGLSGAAVLAALGALRMGAGLVTVLADADVRAEIAAQVPEAMVRAWEGRVPEATDVLLVGPGGVTEIPEWNGPLVVDASALKAGEGPRWVARPQTVITPHPGEFRRLFGVAQPEGTTGRLAHLREVARGPGVVLLKGPQSLVAGGDSPMVRVNDTGHPGLATGGTGDFLAGMVAGAWGRSLEPDWSAPLEAAASAAWLHGRCADRLGQGPLLPRDLAEELPWLLRDLHAGRPA